MQSLEEKVKYYKTDEKEIALDDFVGIAEHYDKGYLFGRRTHNYMFQTRSLRLNLNYFKPNSENRRIVKKFSGQELQLTAIDLPLDPSDYDWRIHKIGKEFYATKFNNVKFSANKIKEMLTTNFSFNTFFFYHDEIENNTEDNPATLSDLVGHTKGYAICYKEKNFLHYCYPFYDLSQETNNLGMYMMLQAISYSQIYGNKYVYLGGATRPTDKYKLQFQGLEWWDGENWSQDIAALKDLIR